MKAEECCSTEQRNSQVRRLKRSTHDRPRPIVHFSPALTVLFCNEELIAVIDHDIGKIEERFWKILPGHYHAERESRCHTVPLHQRGVICDWSIGSAKRLSRIS